MHQNSLSRKLTDMRLRRLKSRRIVRKISDGGGLYVLVAPTGGRYWRYNYRFDGKQKTIALGIYPDVSLDQARARHQAARRLLAAGVDPARRKRDLRNARSLQSNPDAPYGRPMGWGDLFRSAGQWLETANIGYSQTPITLRFAVIRTSSYP